MSPATSLSYFSSSRTLMSISNPDQYSPRQNAMHRRNYVAFDPAEWKLQRCQKRLQTLDMDSAFDRAQERIQWRAKRWTERLNASLQPYKSCNRDQLSDRKKYKEVSKDSFTFKEKSARITERHAFLNVRGREIDETNDLKSRSRDNNGMLELRSRQEATEKSTNVQCTVLRKLEQSRHQNDVVGDNDSEYTWTSCSSGDNSDAELEPVKPTTDVPKQAQPLKEVKGAEGKLRPEINLTTEVKKLKAVFPVKKERDLSWLQAKFDSLAIDSMHTLLEKWLLNVKEWKLDPLEGLKGKANSTVLIGTRRTDPYPRLRDEVFEYKGSRNFYGKPHGKGKITYENGDMFFGEFRNGMREGQGTLKPVSGDIVYLDGSYTNDILEGKGKIEYRNGNILYAWFSSGTIHGLGKMYNKDHNLLHMGWYSNGKLGGTVWYFLTGGGCITGEADMTGNLIGDNVAFLYPDHQTVLLGTFIKNQMIMAQTCFIQMITVRNELCQLRFTNPRGPYFAYDPGTELHICKEPLLPDPYESQYAYVRKSRIKGAQDGLFAKRDLPSNFIVAFYNGIKLKSDEVEHNKDDWEANAYKILDLKGPDEKGLEGILDIPENCVNTKNYRASLAHKANHSFTPNAKFTLFDYPRFGQIPAIITLCPVDKDDEVTVSYDYAMDEAPPWYQELFAKRIIKQYRESRSWNF